MNTEELIVIADALNNQKNYQGVIDLLTDDLLKQQKNGDLYFRSGFAKNELGLFSNAIADYSESIRLGYNNRSVYNNRGHGWQSIGAYSEAEKDFDKAIELSPEFLLAYRNKGKTLEKKGDDESALTVYEEALKIDPNDSKTKLLRDKLAAKLNKPIPQKNDDEGDANNADSPFYKITASLIDIKSSKEHGDLLQYYQRDIDPIIEAIRKQATNVNSIWQSDGEQYDEQAPKYIAHYTNLKVADLIIMKEEKTDDITKTEARLRYSNAIFMNDPEEGKTLIDSIDHLEKKEKGMSDEQDGDIKKAFYNVLKEEKTDFYLGSFLPVIRGHEDELLMWRTYGKDETSKEAAGCCIVIDANFFDESNDKRIAMDDDKNPDYKASHPLYRVLYYNKRYKRFDQENEGGVLTKEVDNLKNALVTLLKMKRNDGTDDGKMHDKAIDKVLYHSLSELRYFFKSADYAYENELRVIQFATHPDTVKIDTENGTIPRKMYIESTKGVKQHIHKIVLGPMVRHPERWQYLSKHLKDTLGKEIEVVTSNCNFQ